MLPAADAPFLARGALVFEGTSTANICPVTADNH
jgi:hypothetical protein